MKKSIAIVLLLLIFHSSQIKAYKIDYNHHSLKIEELTPKVDFHVLVPIHLNNDFTLEVKTYPEGETDQITEFRLHYMDKNDRMLLVGIAEKKMDEDEVKLDSSGEAVQINGNTGTYKNFANASGGILSWVQDGTYVEMDSSLLSREEMVKLAKSMERVN